MYFEKYVGYTTFLAEHAFDDDAIVFHFFVTPENNSREYWQEKFPPVLSEVAQEVFQAGYPRLRAAFTAEHNSWWMRADGFANEGIPKERIARFYDALDQALDAAKAK